MSPGNVKDGRLVPETGSEPSFIQICRESSESASACFNGRTLRLSLDLYLCSQTPKANPIKVELYRFSLSPSRMVHKKEELQL